MKCILVVVGLMLIGGCTSVKVHVNYDPGFDFSTFKTYGWAVHAERGKVNMLDENPILEARIKRIVDQQLQAMGYVKVKNEEADFYIGAFGTVTSQTSVTQVNDYYAYDPSWNTYGGTYPGEVWARPTRTYVYTYEEGTLILDISTSRKQLVWRGTAAAELDESRSQENTDKLLGQAVGKMFNDFPPGQTK